LLLSYYQIKDPAVRNNNALNKACVEQLDLVGRLLDIQLLGQVVLVWIKQYFLNVIFIYCAYITRTDFVELFLIPCLKGQAHNSDTKCSISDE